MSSFDRRSLLKLTTVSAASSALAGCFQPLYGSTTSGGSMSQTLAAIDVDTVPANAKRDFLAHTLRSELISELTGFGANPNVPKRYRLKLTYNEEVRSPILDQTTGRSETATLIGSVDYILTEGDKTLTSGKAQASATYERTAQRFATVRAARDADERLGKTLAQQIKTRLAAFFATGR